MTRQFAFDQSELADATNVLLVASEVGQSVESLFSEFLLSLELPPEHVVGVTTSKPSQAFYEPWNEALSNETTSFSFVETDSFARSATARSSPDSLTGSTFDVTHVTDVTPLGAFGTAIADQIPDTGDETAVCFHSLTDLLAYVDLETAFRFLHAVLSRVREKDARGIYHIDRYVHDEETIANLSTLFDIVVEFGSPAYDGDSNAAVGGSP